MCQQAPFIRGFLQSEDPSLPGDVCHTIRCTLEQLLSPIEPSRPWRSRSQSTNCRTCRPLSIPRTRILLRQSQHFCAATDLPPCFCPHALGGPAFPFTKQLVSILCFHYFRLPKPTARPGRVRAPISSQGTGERWQIYKPRTDQYRGDLAARSIIMSTPANVSHTSCSTAPSLSELERRVLFSGHAHQVYTTAPDARWYVVPAVLCMCRSGG